MKLAHFDSHGVTQIAYSPRTVIIKLQSKIEAQVLTQLLLNTTANTELESLMLGRILSTLQAAIAQEPSV